MSRFTVFLTTCWFAGLLASTASAAERNDTVALLRAKVETLEQKALTLEREVAALKKQLVALQPVREECEARQRTEKEVQDLGGVPGPIESTGKMVAIQTPLKVGDVLQIEENGQWWAGRVLKLLADGSVRVHYIGWEPWYDLAVPRCRLQLDPDAWTKAKQTVVAQPTGTSRCARVPVQPTGIPVTDKTPLKPGDSVLVEWTGHWWDGTVLEVLPDATVKVRYVGWGPKWDEVVARSRLRTKTEKEAADQATPRSTD